MSKSEPSQSHVVMLPRESRTADTHEGPATFTVGSGFDQVVMVMTPAAAHLLAMFLSTSTLPDVVPEMRHLRPRLMIDLITSAAASDPRVNPEVKHVRLEGTAQ